MNLSTEAAIDLIIGPMYGGKSTELIRKLNIYYEMNVKALYINSKLDIYEPTILFGSEPRKSPATDITFDA